MAAPRCYACQEPIIGILRSCSFCARFYHPNCDPDQTSLDTGFVCSFGCMQAYNIGKNRGKHRHKHRCECGKVYSKACNLRRHQQTAHSGARFGPCPCCKPPRCFVAKQKLQQHLQRQKVLTQESLQLLEGNSTDATHDAAPCPTLCLSLCPHVPRSNQPITQTKPSFGSAVAACKLQTQTKPSLGSAVAACKLQTQTKSSFGSTVAACTHKLASAEGLPMESLPQPCLLHRATSYNPSGKLTTLTAHAAADPTVCALHCATAYFSVGIAGHECCACYSCPPPMMGSAPPRSRRNTILSQGTETQHNDASSGLPAAQFYQPYPTSKYVVIKPAQS
jgi:hypothetical protein